MDVDRDLDGEVPLLEVTRARRRAQAMASPRLASKVVRHQSRGDSPNEALLIRE